MKILKIAKAIFLALLLSVAISGGTQIFADLEAEKCKYHNGHCDDNGCSSAGGVCGMQEAVDGARAPFDPCWCLF